MDSNWRGNLSAAVPAHFCRRENRFSAPWAWTLDADWSDRFGVTGRHTEDALCFGSVEWNHRVLSAALRAGIDPLRSRPDEVQEPWDNKDEQQNDQEAAIDLAADTWANFIPAILAQVCRR
jgi:hypothetical protein